MSLQSIFPHLRGFRLLAFCREPERLVVTCERITQSASCPLCGAQAQRIHSHYQRTVSDVSIQATPVLLRLCVRKFYCDQPECPRRIFTERLPQVTPPHGRFTEGLHHLLGQLGQEHGGASGARSAQLLGLCVTGRAVLRFMHALPLPAFPSPRIIGVDDWAWKRRERYGAIIVDLERGTPIALLADRSQETVRPWLEQHPTIDVVARDRSKEFAAAIAAALPHATQVADRWHLACNLTDQVDKVISARWKQLTKAGRPADVSLLDLGTSPPPPPQRRQSAGEARYERVLALAQAGLPVKSIAARLGVSHQTIYRWLAQEHGPHAGPRKQRAGTLDWTTPYLRKRWEEGEDNGLHLWEELKTRGYTGSLRSIYRRLALFRGGPRPYRSPSPASAEAIPRSPLEDVTPGKVIGWIIARPETLTPAGRERLECVCQMDPVIVQARDLAQRWLGFIRSHTSEGLDVWLREVRACAIPALVSFARSVGRDKAAIIAGLSLSYSTGPVEGHITRLKLIKRQAYGRAGLSYLQHRFLAAA